MFSNCIKCNKIKSNVIEERYSDALINRTSLTVRNFLFKKGLYLYIKKVDKYDYEFEIPYESIVTKIIELDTEYLISNRKKNYILDETEALKIIIITRYGYKVREYSKKGKIKSEIYKNLYECDICNDVILTSDQNGISKFKCDCINKYICFKCTEQCVHCPFCRSKS